MYKAKPSHFVNFRDRQLGCQTRPGFVLKLAITLVETCDSFILIVVTFNNIA